MPPLRIGELLVAEGLLTPAAVNRALGFQQAAAPRARLGSILLTWDLIDEGNLLRALAALHHCEAVTGDMLANAPADVVRLLPASHAIRLNAIPYALSRSRIRVAFVNPSDLGAIDEASALTGHICTPGVVTELRLMQAHRRYYGRAIPTELRPVLPRVDRDRPSRSTSRTTPPALIPVLGRPTSGAAEEPAPITIPDLPIPLRPSAAHGVPNQMGPADLAAARPGLPPPVVEGAGARAAMSDSQAEIGDLALASVPAEFPRAILLSDRDGALVAWRARGVSTEGLATIRIPGAEPSVFATAARSGTPHFGRVEPEAWPGPLAKLFDGPPPCALLPIHTGRGSILLLYADRLGAPMKFDDMGLLARAAAEIAALLARAPAG
jgi:MshEN domain